SRTGVVSAVGSTSPGFGANPLSAGPHVPRSSTTQSLMLAPLARRRVLPPPIRSLPPPLRRRRQQPRARRIPLRSPRIRDPGLEPELRSRRDAGGPDAGEGPGAVGAGGDRLEEDGGGGDEGAAEEGEVDLLGADDQDAAGVRRGV